MQHCADQAYRHSFGNASCYCHPHVQASMQYIVVRHLSNNADARSMGVQMIIKQCYMQCCLRCKLVHACAHVRLRNLYSLCKRLRNAMQCIMLCNYQLMNNHRRLLSFFR